MTRQSPPSRQPARSGVEERAWLPRAAFAFVVLALVALAVTPNLLLRRVSHAMDELVTTLLPTNEALSDLAFAMEERVTASRSRFVSRDPRYDARLEAAKEAEREALQVLAELAPRIGNSTEQRFAAIRRYMARRDSIEAEVVAQGEDPEAYRAALPRFDAIRDSILVELTGFRRELIREAQGRAAEEVRWAARQRAVSVLIGVLAILAALMVGWFAVRERQFRERIQKALEEANRQRALAERRGTELERAAEARARLLRGVTHDVKNPLGAAKGYAELLEMGVKGPLLPEQVPLVKGLSRSVDSALAILTDLLDLARVDSGGLGVNRVAVDLDAVVRDALEAHRAAAENAGHTLEFKAAGQLPTLYTDPARVDQILGNLLSNAIKYTPRPGCITVRVGARSREQETDPRAWVTVEVIDTGPGIPPEHREAIFDEFTRFANHGHEGHGLGLAIARRVARLLGGDLTVEDAPGGGACFILWLPARQEDSRGDLAGAARETQAGARETITNYELRITNDQF
ncbi:MAG TPA: HAMP domain-containing sensor histidine kinase [Longimicrobiaceae bacterium]